MPSVVTVCLLVRDPAVAALRACVGSILDQRRVEWEALLVDASGSATISAELRDLAAVEARCRVWAAEPGEVATVANEALAAAAGEVVVLIDEGTALEPTALRAVVGAAETGADVDCIYADEDALADDGEWLPFHKPDWSPERARAQPYTGPLTALRRSLALEVGGFRLGVAGAETDDLVLRVTERARRVSHVPRILAHRPAPGSEDPAVQRRRREARRQVVADHVARCGIAATVEPIPETDSLRVRRRPADPPARVSIVIPTRGASRPVWGEDGPLVLRCVTSVVATTAGQTCEIIVVADPETPERVVADLKRLGANVVAASGPFSFSQRCNLGVAASHHELVLLLNDDVVVEQPDWLDVLTGFFAEPDVGIVGARLLYADGRLQHGGVLLNEQPLHAFHGFPGEQRGPYDLLRVDREVSAVTAACLMTRRSLLEELGGLDEGFAVAFNDVDLCLRARRLGQRIIWTPHCTLYHFESQSRARRPAPTEVDLLYERWGSELAQDPYGNPQLAPKQAFWLPRLRHRLAGPLAAARAERRRASASTPLATLATRRARS